MSHVMTDNPLFRVLGVALMVFGVGLSANPELLSSAPVPEDVFEAVERRVWWGAFVGGGLLLLFHLSLQPWMRTLAAASAALLLGLLVARLIGIALDGSVARQWVYVGIEVFLLAAAVLWSRRLNTPTSD